MADGTIMDGATHEQTQDKILLAGTWLSKIKLVHW
jgi:hypothetical protein